MPVRMLCLPRVIERISPSVVEGAVNSRSIFAVAVPKTIPPALGAMRISGRPGKVLAFARLMPTSESLTGSSGNEPCRMKL